MRFNPLSSFFSSEGKTFEKSTLLVKGTLMTEGRSEGRLGDASARGRLDILTDKISCLFLFVHHCKFNMPPLMRIFWKVVIIIVNQQVLIRRIDLFEPLSRGRLARTLSFQDTFSRHLHLLHLNLTLRR